MTQWHMKSERKPSGGKRGSLERCSKRLAWRGSEPALTTVAREPELRIVRAKGGSRKVKSKHADFANVSTGGKAINVRITRVLENAANRQYARQNVITKNALIEIETNEGKRIARVTSRPGQSGVVNAVLASEAELTQKKPKQPKKAKGAAHAKKDVGASE